jgi:hypothetical protein
VNKQNYIDLGRADAAAGNPQRAFASATWMSTAYKQGYEDVTRHVFVVPHKVKEVVPRRTVNLLRRAEATIARIAHRHALRKLGSKLVSPKRQHVNANSWRRDHGLAD